MTKATHTNYGSHAVRKSRDEEILDTIRKDRARWRKSMDEQKKKTKDDQVVHPNHYERWAVEPVTFIMDNGLEFWRGNVIKYVMRAGLKEGQSEVTDLQKAKRYIEMRINQLEGKPPNAVS